MSERVEEIRRKHEGFHFCEPTGDVHALLTALAQAEREREFERERADNQHEAAEMFQNQYREALQERDHSRGLVNGLIAERNAARAEVERLNREHDNYVLGEGQRMATLLDLKLAEASGMISSLEAALARVRAALETAANRLDIAASVIRSGAKFARWADEARAALEGRG